MNRTDEIRIERWRPNSSNLAKDIKMLAEVLHEWVRAGASVSFVLPFSTDDASAFWQNQVLSAVRAGTLLRPGRSQRGAHSGHRTTRSRHPPNQSHRAEVRKLLVHPQERRRGIARRLMNELEGYARAARRSLITLDTTTGGFAEPLYLSIGYVRAGLIPRYSRRADSPEVDGTTLMYKELAP
jgi:GNAT superfamily N-acetyltransferase